MVQFHEHIITELIEDANGGLVILSSGLSLAKLISSLLFIHSPDQGTLLLLSPASNSNLSLKSQILHYFTTQSHDSQSFPYEISADLPAHQRLALYSSGSIFFVTPRILIVDLLTHKLPTSNIAGLILLNAHLLIETSVEAFIVRIIRSLNITAYIRAFSDKPHAMVSGFAKTERIMKCLYIRRLHLWPRFQVYVSEELEKDPPIVVDFRVPMTRYMVGIQKAIIEVMDACLKEMRKTNKVDVEDLTVENGLFKSFDEIIRRQLDPIWHTLGKKTRQLVSDLKTLRKLLEYLVRYDAVTYLKYLDTLRASESFRSIWIFAESSYKIFDFAKKRVYQFVRSDGTKINVQSRRGSSKRRKMKGSNKMEEEAVNAGLIVDEILEEPPKWKVLRDVLEEIEEEIQNNASSNDELGEVEESNNDIVLVACKDERSCLQLEECITTSPQKVMQSEWENYLLNKLELSHFQKNYKKKPRDPKGFGVLDGVVPITPVQKTEASSLNREEHVALHEAASKVRNRLKKDSLIVGDSQINGNNNGHRKGKKKVKKNCTPNFQSSAVIENDLTQIPDGNKAEIHESNCDCETEKTFSVSHDFSEISNQGILLDDGVIGKISEDISGMSSKKVKPIPAVHFYALESDQPILDILKPSVIIVYHPDMPFVRQLEVYKAENPSKRLKVYFLFYEESTEVQKFEASIRRENGAFESLIRQKSLMMIPVDQEGNCLGSCSVEPQITISQNSTTRKAGGRKEVKKEIQVVVDMREFMSSLPNVLHQKGMNIIPVTLEVGDYILSPQICVERKSIQDLFMSFSSGRLYHQAETMVRYYRIPVLLIEFSLDKSFSFQSESELGDDVTPNNIISKLSLLALHFPRLRIIWSRSLYATAEIFTSLKANQDEPDETKAIRVGIPSEDGMVENDVRAENYNTSAVEFLRRLPGVTDSNYRAIIDGCKSLAELSLLPIERLAELMGGPKNARMLREFLDAKARHAKFVSSVRPINVKGSLETMMLLKMKIEEHREQYVTLLARQKEDFNIMRLKWIHPPMPYRSGL